MAFVRIGGIEPICANFFTITAAKVLENPDQAVFMLTMMATTTDGQNNYFIFLAHACGVIKSNINFVV